MDWLIKNGAKNPYPNQDNNFGYWIKGVKTGEGRSSCFYFIPSGEILKLLIKWHPNEPSLL